MLEEGFMKFCVGLIVVCSMIIVFTLVFGFPKAPHVSREVSYPDATERYSDTEEVFTTGSNNTAVGYMAFAAQGTSENVDMGDTYYESGKQVLGHKK